MAVIVIMVIVVVVIVAIVVGAVWFYGRFLAPITSKGILPFRSTSRVYVYLKNNITKKKQSH